MEKDSQPLFDERELDELNDLDIPDVAEAKPVAASADAPRTSAPTSAPSSAVTASSSAPPAKPTLANPASSTASPPPSTTEKKAPAPTAAATPAPATAAPRTLPAATAETSRASQFVATADTPAATTKAETAKTAQDAHLTPPRDAVEQQSLQQIQLILEQIQAAVDQLARERRHRTFSVARLIGAVAQVVAVAFVVLAVADAAFDRQADQHLNLMFAVVFQLGALTAFFLGQEAE